MAQAVILAAGKSTRTYPLTLNKHKCLLKTAGKTLMEHLLDQVIDCGIDETIIVVNHGKEGIINKFGDSYKGMRLRYHTQSEPLGTWHAVKELENIVQDKFLVLYGDDIVHSEDLKEVMKEHYGSLFMRTQHPERFGIAKVDNGLLKEIVEKPKNHIGDLASIGGFWLDKEFFKYPLELEQGQAEYYMTTPITKLCSEYDVKPVVIKRYWMPTGYPWDLLTINEFLMQSVQDNREGFIEQGATINGKLSLGKGTLVKAGSYIEGNVIIGENCTIGPNCYIRDGTSIGDNCQIGNAVEIKNSIIMDNTNVSHLSFIGDSILGDNVNIGAGTITANLRHDGKNVKCEAKGELIDTGRRKLGAIIADGAKTGINTSIMPGRMIWPGEYTLPAEILKKNKIRTS